MAALENTQLAVATDSKAAAERRKALALILKNKYQPLDDQLLHKIARAKAELAPPKPGSLRKIDATMRARYQSDLDRYKKAFDFDKARYAKIMDPICAVNPGIDGCDGAKAAEMVLTTR
ncbi:MAG: hypothetical protein M1829_005474 [Trizodia sp. TS-e1964]|nr:MAG: hypothetical protein M1829_005474 [Trizodia sp. TS-e1964]